MVRGGGEKPDEDTSNHEYMIKFLGGPESRGELKSYTQ